MFTMELYSCSLNQAPDRVDSPGVEKNGIMQLDLTGTWLTSRKRAKTGLTTQGTVRQIKINTVLIMGSKKGTSEVWGYVDRKKVGEAKIEYASSATRRGGRAVGQL